MQANSNKIKRLMTSVLVTIPTTSIGYRFDIQINQWSDGFGAFRCYANGNKELIEGGIGIGLDFVQGGVEKEEWLSIIPSDLLEQTLVFPEHQYQMLWLAANSKNAADILSLRPLIIAMLCERYSADNTVALELAEQGQRQILARLGFASSRAALKFIDKLELTYERVSEIHHVMKMLDVRTSHFKRFSHYTKVNFPSLSLDNTHPFLTGTHLGRSIGEMDNTARLKLTLCIEDTLMLGQALGVQDPMANIVSLKNYDALVQLHDEWVRRRNQLHTEQMKPVDTDVPYKAHLGETDSITQIVDYFDLCKEGDEMRHCISVYHNRIAHGRYVVFRLTHPERMTVGLTINPAKKFPYEVDQIAGVRNKLPSDETREVVYEWLLNIKQLTH
ncbi:PcfJ domain-containing protein [Aliivibrio fischeri]|uniref:PcfJ domain-containing protein n=1 Tax=Aliivibrio fischeri TaxID=668 RepID=UPI0009B993AD|nr:PcfJ domain-containing protein [Aliivibrio fischeri]